ncbi:hypothetical protein DVH02_10645 [Streptomyces corynorhini]|uniref:Uncharacterized protein n=1 Tax=Streptomyces corynorhini TaxID=2282652 RepID=A0A370BBW4_9ACTN|nr:hypothetical protein DVH02_10645 [Streptomyces corynorhini]
MASMSLVTWSRYIGCPLTSASVMALFRISQPLGVERSRWWRQSLSLSASEAGMRRCAGKV